MGSTFYNIANRIVEVRGLHERGATISLPGFGVFATMPTAPDLSINFGIRIEIPRIKVAHEFDMVEAHYHCALYVAGSEHWFSMWRKGNKPYTIHYGGETEAEATDVDDPVALRFMLWMAVAMYGTLRGFAPIHAACVEHEGRGYLFLGESGTGKSTHARLWLASIEGCTLLNDDSPIVDISTNVPMVYGSPWSGKTPCFNNCGVPIGGIVRLHQAATNNVVQLNALHAFAAIEPSLPPALRYSAVFTEGRMMMIDSLLRSTKVLSMGCVRDATAALTCFEACVSEPDPTSTRT